MSPYSNPMHVILVDDDHAVAGLISRCLRLADLPVTLVHRCTLHDGLVAAMLEPFDAMLLDLNLPDSSGIETAQDVCGALPELTVVVITNADDDMGEEAMDAGAEDFITKSIFQEVDLARAGYVIAKVLRHSIRRHSLRQIMVDEAAQKAAIRARVDEHTRVLVEALAEARTEIRRSTEALDDSTATN